MKINSLDEKNKYFTRQMFYRFFIPSILSSVGLSLGNIVDALVVGSRMGETGLAAIGLITPIYMIYNVNPFDVNTKKIQLENEEGMESVGLLMVKSKAKDFFYRRYQGFNTLTVKV